MGKENDIDFKLTHDHIKKVCKPGNEAQTCRFLAMGPGGVEGFYCAKFGLLTNTINESADSGQMNARGNNCDALLGEIIKAKSTLIGKKVFYKETMPTIEITGTLEDIIYEKDKNSLSLKVRGDEEKDLPLDVHNLKYLQITREPDGFVFSACGLGTFAGSTKIFL